MKVALGWEGLGRVDPVISRAPQAPGSCHHRWELRLPASNGQGLQPNRICCLACSQVVL